MAHAEDTNPRHRVPGRRAASNGDGSAESPSFSADWHYESSGTPPDHRGHRWAVTIAAVVGTLLAIGGAVWGLGELTADKVDAEEVDYAIDRHAEKEQHPQTRQQINAIRRDISAIKTGQAEAAVHAKATDKKVESIDATLKAINSRMGRRYRRERRNRRASGTDRQ